MSRVTIKGYGQIELNNVAFRRDGRIEAQCALYDKEFAKNQAEYVGGKIYAENGMILAVDNINRVVRLPGAEAADLPLAINYSTEHLYDERHQGLKDFYLPAGTFYHLHSHEVVRYCVAFVRLFAVCGALRGVCGLLAAE